MSEQIALSALGQLLEEKDREIEKLQSEVDEFKDLIDYSWCRHAEVEESGLPVPRLEIVFTEISPFDFSWEYGLVYRHFLGNLIRVPFGFTKVGGSPDRIVPGDLPFRDGAHIRHDARLLGLPAFSVVRGVAARVDAEVSA